MKSCFAVLALVLSSLVGPAASQSAPAKSPATIDYASIDALFETYMHENHAPGVVYGVVHEGKLIRVRTFGVQNTQSKVPLSADTVFPIASMTKNFTALAALKLRDQGRLHLDAPVERYVPEFKSVRLPTSDSPKVRVRDLLSHGGGFVYDDPWGDRQMNMSDASLDAFLRSGFPLSRAPQTAFEYSNFGFAMLGRVIRNVSGRAYSDYVMREILRPLGMSSSGFEVRNVAAARFATGYRWEDDRWIEEPVLGDGAFAAMGGLHTTANDYAKYVAFVLTAWPAREGVESSILKRASVREIALGGNLPLLSRRPTPERGDASGCDTAMAYGLGMWSRVDCRFGMWLTHAGGLPGYGSDVIMLPQRNLGMFAFSNLTYAPLPSTLRLALRQLIESGAFPPRVVPASTGLMAVKDAAARIYAAGDVLAARDALAMNFLLDRDAAHRNADLAKLKADLGACTTLEALNATTAMQGEAIWTCERGRLRARMLVAPTLQPSLQMLDWDKMN